MMASIGVPGLNGFVGEFLVLFGFFGTHGWWARRRDARRDRRRHLPAVGVPAGLPRRAARGGRRDRRPRLRWSAPCSRRSSSIIVFLGVYPKPVLDRIKPSVNQLVAHVEKTTGHRSPPSAVKGVERREVIATLLATSHATLTASGPSPSPPSAGWRSCRPSSCSAAPCCCSSWPRSSRGRLRTSARPPPRWSSRRARARRRRLLVQWLDVSDHGASTTFVSTRSSRTASRLVAMLGVIAISLGCRSRVRRLAAPRGHPRRRVPRPGPGLGLGRHAHGPGERPHRDLPRPRDPLDRAVRAGRVRPPAVARRARRRSSTSSSAASRRRSSSTASRSPTGRPARPT